MLNRFQNELGVTAVQLPKDVLEALQVASEEVFAEESAKDEMFKKVYESQLAFQKENKDWHNLGYLPRDWPVEPAAN